MRIVLSALAALIWCATAAAQAPLGAAQEPLLRPLPLAGEGVT